MTTNPDDSEPVTGGAPRAITQRGLPDDPLGVDTRKPFWSVARDIAERAHSGRAKRRQ